MTAVHDASTDHANGRSQDSNGAAIRARWLFSDRLQKCCRRILMAKWFVTMVIAITITSVTTSNVAAAPAGLPAPRDFCDVLPTADEIAHGVPNVGQSIEACIEEQNKLARAEAAQSIKTFDHDLAAGRLSDSGLQVAYQALDEKDRHQSLGSEVAWRLLMVEPYTDKATEIANTSILALNLSNFDIGTVVSNHDKLRAAIVFAAYNASLCHALSHYLAAIGPTGIATSDEALKLATYTAAAKCLASLGELGEAKLRVRELARATNLLSLGPNGLLRANTLAFLAVEVNDAEILGVVENASRPWLLTANIHQAAQLAQSIEFAHTEIDNSPQKPPPLFGCHEPTLSSTQECKVAAAIVRTVNGSPPSAAGNRATFSELKSLRSTDPLSVRIALYLAASDIGAGIDRGDTQIIEQTVSLPGDDSAALLASCLEVQVRWGNGRPVTGDRMFAVESHPSPQGRMKALLLTCLRDQSTHFAVVLAADQIARLANWLMSLENDDPMSGTLDIQIKLAKASFVDGDYQSARKQLISIASQKSAIPPASFREIAKLLAWSSFLTSAPNSHDRGSNLNNLVDQISPTLKSLREGTLSLPNALGVSLDDELLVKVGDEIALVANQARFFNKLGDELDDPLLPAQIIKNTPHSVSAWQGYIRSVQSELVSAVPDPANRRCADNVLRASLALTSPIALDEQALVTSSVVESGGFDPPFLPRTSSQSSFSVYRPSLHDELEKMEFVVGSWSQRHNGQNAYSAFELRERIREAALPVDDWRGCSELSLASLEEPSNDLRGQLYRLTYSQSGLFDNQRLSLIATLLAPPSDASPPTSSVVLRQRIHALRRQLERSSADLDGEAALFEKAEEEHLWAQLYRNQWTGIKIDRIAPRFSWPQTGGADAIVISSYDSEPFDGSFDSGGTINSELILDGNIYTSATNYPDGLKLNDFKQDLDPEDIDDVTKFHGGAAYDLYRGIIGPFEGRLSRVRTIYFVGGGNLAGLPIQALLMRKPPHLDSGGLVSVVSAKGAWLIDRYDVAMGVPSVGAKGVRQAAPRGVLEVVDPDYGEPVDEQSGAVASAIPPSSGHLTSILARTCGVFSDLSSVAPVGNFAVASDPRIKVLDGPRASATALRNLSASGELRNYSGLVFYAHGTEVREGYVGGNPSHSAAIALSPSPPCNEPAGSHADSGYFTASEVPDLELNVDWVMLAGCLTAVEGSSPDGAPSSSLATAFLSRGASLAIGSTTPVDAKATVALVKGLAEHTVTESPMHAAGMSLRAIANSPGHPEWASPAFWGSWLVFGKLN